MPFERQHRNPRKAALAAAVGVGATLLLFAAVPLANYLSLRTDNNRRPTTLAEAPPAPPPPPERLQPPPEDKADVEQPELRERPPPLTLAAIDAILNPGTGGASGDFNLGQTLAGFDALDEIGIFDLADLDKHPIPIQRVAPVYPYEAKQAGIHGWVNILFIVDENGSVRDPRIDQSSDRVFEAAALDAIRLWKFTPGVRDGRNVRTRMLQPLHFSVGQI